MICWRIFCANSTWCRQTRQAVWVFLFFTGRDYRASLWPGAWSEWPCVLKWSAAVVGQAAWRLQKENLKFAGAGFGSSFIFAWRLWLSGYLQIVQNGKKDPCHESRGPRIIQQYSLFSSSRFQAVHIETLVTNNIVVAIVIDLYAWTHSAGFAAIIRQ